MRFEIVLYVLFLAQTVKICYTAARKQNSALRKNDAQYQQLRCKRKT